MRGRHTAVAQWAVLVPVKPLAAAKRRLRGAVGAGRHEELVLAMARDTVAAVLAATGVATVAVVTVDPVVAAAVTDLGGRWVPEPGGGGLNAALIHAAAVVDRDGGRRLAALPADLPALRPTELAAALAAAGPDAGYVADAAGTGTVLLTAPAGGTLAPRFGPGSAAAHRRAGARELAGDWPALRRDVDTPDDLAAAARLGLGPRTAALLGAALR